MMVTDIVREEVIYDGEWKTEPGDPSDQIEKYNKGRRRFLFYPWGVWCTAYARRNLWYGIANFGKDYIYADTDSIFYLADSPHEEFINDYNNLCEYKLKKMCAYHGIDYEAELLPKTIKGVIKPLGVWDFEPHIDKFKTLGAKRYMTYIDGELSITVSGVNKTTAVPWLLKRTKKHNFKAYLKYKGYSFNYFFVNRHKTMKDFNKYCCELCFEAFEEQLIVPEDATGKLTHYYIDKAYEGDIVDYKGIPYHYIAPSGVYLEKASYSFNIDREYLDFLKGVFYTK